MYGLERLTYLCLKDDTHTDFHTAFATEELRATPPTVLCSVSLSITVYTKTRNPAALVFIPICAGRRAGMRIFMAQNTPVMKMTRRYGRTVYEVAAYCSPDSKATYEDRLLQLIRHAAKEESVSDASDDDDSV